MRRRIELRAARGGLSSERATKYAAVTARRTGCGVGGRFAAARNPEVGGAVYAEPLIVSREIIAFLRSKFYFIIKAF
jgi:hypothetical protein